MTIRKISEDVFQITLQRHEDEKLIFYGFSKREVVGKLKQHLRAEAML